MGFELFPFRINDAQAIVSQAAIGVLQRQRYPVLDRLDPSALREEFDSQTPCGA